MVPVFAEGVWQTYADPSQVGDALLNLAINARDAMPQGGCLTIEIANVHLDDDDTAQMVQAISGDYIVLSVTDTGCGMTQETVNRAIEPFFTTKPLGIGTGLGLSTIFGFAEQSGGHLRDLQ